MIQVRVKFACFVTLLSVVCQSLGQAPPPSPGGGQGYFEVTYSGGAWSSTGEAGTVVGTYGPEQQENWGGGGFNGRRSRGSSGYGLGTWLRELLWNDHRYFHLEQRRESG